MIVFVYQFPDKNILTANTGNTLKTLCSWVILPSFFFLSFADIFFKSFFFKLLQDQHFVPNLFTMEFYKGIIGIIGNGHFSIIPL